VKPRALLRRISSGALTNIDFRDFVRLARAFGFRVARTKGSHHILHHPEIPELLNLQKVQEEAKPYQIRQFLSLTERYNLQLSSDE
jgi:predicted RNA binding protein YcfA (HicA-like mRNA interferase family)